MRPDIIFCACIVGILLGILVPDRVFTSMRYKPGRNKYHRVCKKCGAHQVVFASFLGTWWEEVHPVGDDPDCRCHADAEYWNW